MPRGTCSKDISSIFIIFFCLGAAFAIENQNSTNEDLGIQPEDYNYSIYNNNDTERESSDTSTIGEIGLQESNYKLNDSDIFGLGEYKKIESGTNISNEDTDNDGLNDTEEIWWACDPTKNDTDGDGYLDGDEVHLRINDPKKGDGCPYTEDRLKGTDNDGDGLPVGAEISVLKTDPNSKSSDGDRYSDGLEVLGFDFYGKESIPDYVDHDPHSPATADIVLEIDPKVKLNLAKSVKEESKKLDSIEKSYNAERGFKEAATLKTVAGASVSSEASVGFPPWGSKASVKSEIHMNIDLEAEAGFSASQTWTSKHGGSSETSKIEEVDLSGSTLQIVVNIRNIGDDFASEGIDELRLNFYMGNDEEPFYTYSHDDVIGKTFKPGGQFKITIRDIPIDYELFKRLISGEGVRVGVAHYSFGEDQKYLTNAKARCVEINLDDGTGLIKRRIAPSVQRMTLHDALNLSEISIALENGTISSVNGKEIKSGWPPYMWWTFSIIRQQVQGGKSSNIRDLNHSGNILNAEVYPGDLIFLKYQMDSDGDLLPDAEERMIGTRPDRPDTDEDGLWDGDSIPEKEVKGENELGTSPLLKDTDNDSKNDSIDTQPLDALYNVPDMERPDSVVLYDHKDYDGTATEFWDDSPDLGDLNDKVQSLKVPWGSNVELFENVSYGGRSKIFTNDTPWVGDDFFDMASSMKIKRIELFEHRNFKPKSKIIAKPDVSYIGPEFDDKVESLTVPNGYEVTLYENSNFTGKNATYLEDQEWVGIELHDSVSSIRINRKTSILKTNEYLKVGDYLVSSNGKYLAIMQEDGRFCVYAGTGPQDMRKPVWRSPKSKYGYGQYFAIMQSDGNFCVYRGTGPSNRGKCVWCWSDKSSGEGEYFAIMQDDGNFCVYRGTGSENRGAHIWCPYSDPKKLSEATA